MRDALYSDFPQVTLAQLSGLTLTKARSQVDIDGPSRRDFLKQTSLAALVAGLDPFSLTSEAAARVATILSGSRVDLLSLLGRTFDRNTLKLFAVTSDQPLPDSAECQDPTKCNRVFVAGILSQYVSILNGSTHASVATVDTGITENSYKNLAVDTTANRLYVRDTLNETLSSVNLATGEPTETIELCGQVGGMIADPGRGLVYITTTQAPGFRAYNGATLTLDSSITSMGTALLSMVHDPSTDELYLLDSSMPNVSGAGGRIYRLPLGTPNPTAITFTLGGTARPSTLARSRASSRFYVIVGGGLTVLTSAGATLHTRSLPGLEFQDMAFDETDRRLLVLFLDPLNEADRKYSASGGRLYAYSGDTLSNPTGAALSEIAAFGRKPHTIHVNSATGRFYCAAGDESTVWSGTSGSNQIGGIRIGDSIEGMLASPADGTLYMNSRLGGSHLVAYNPVSGAATSFAAGIWPTGMAIDPTGAQLVVLNAWDSTISVFSLPSRSLSRPPILIGLPVGTTDRLPDFAVDFTRQRAYASYPEFGQVAVVDLASGMALTPITVEEFATGDIDGGPNQIQIAVCEFTGRLHVMSPSLQRLHVYDVANLAAGPMFEHSLPQTVVQTGTRPLWKLLFVDEQLRRVFVAGVERYADTGAPTSRQLSLGQRVFAADSIRNLYWAGAMENDAINIYSFDRTSLSLVSTYGAGPTDTLAPGLELDAARGRLFVSHLVAAQFDSYTLPVSFTDDPLFTGSTALKAVHVTEMRDAINTVRARYGLTAAVWTDTITAPTTAVKAVHLAEMRTALAAVYTARSVPPPTYTNAITAGSALIKAVNVTELRSAIIAIQ